MARTYRQSSGATPKYLFIDQYARIADRLFRFGRRQLVPASPTSADSPGLLFRIDVSASKSPRSRYARQLIRQRDIHGWHGELRRPRAVTAMAQQSTGGGDRTSGRRPRWTGNRSRSTRTRAGSVWFAVILFAIVLLLLLIFILQNSQQVKISFFGAHGHVPQGVALLLAAVFGILLVALPGTARIIQLHRRHRAATRAASAPPPAEQPTAPPADQSGSALNPSPSQPPAGSPASPPGPSHDRS